MSKIIMFPRNGTYIAATIIKTVIEPLGNSRQVVFFCQDKGGSRYRVPKSEVAIMGSKPREKPRVKRKERKRDKKNKAVVL